MFSKVKNWLSHSSYNHNKYSKYLFGAGTLFLSFLGLKWFLNNKYKIGDNNNSNLSILNNAENNKEGIDKTDTPLSTKKVHNPLQLKSYLYDKDNVSNNYTKDDLNSMRDGSTKLDHSYSSLQEDKHLTIENDNLVSTKTLQKETIAGTSKTDKTNAHHSILAKLKYYYFNPSL